MNLCLFPLPLEPFLLEMTVQDLEFKLMAAMDRISCLEGQVQQLTQQQWQLMQQLETVQQQQQAYGWGNTSLNDPQSEQRDWLWSNHQVSNHLTPIRQEAYERFPQNSPQNVHQQASQQPPLLDGPCAVPIKQRPITSYLPSSSIRKNCLKNPDVIRKYPKLCGESKAGKLAVKLAQEAYFGEDVLSRCTVSGFRELPALPIAELSELKQMMLMQFPKHWNSVQEFESLWLICCDAIGHAAKGLCIQAR